MRVNHGFSLISQQKSTLGLLPLFLSAITPGLEVIKLFPCSAQLSILSTHKYKNTKEIIFSGSDKPRMLFSLTIVGILTFTSRKKSCSAELSMIFITSGPEETNVTFMSFHHVSPFGQVVTSCKQNLSQYVH